MADTVWGLKKYLTVEEVKVTYEYVVISAEQYIFFFYFDFINLERSYRD